MRPNSVPLLAAVLGVLVLTTGCVGLLTGSEPAVFRASPADVSEDALSESDFQLQDERSPWLNETVEVAGQEREVRIQNHVRRYELPASVSVTGGVSYGQFVVASTPEASVAGQAMNPIGRMSHREMLTQFAGDLRDVERVDSRELAVLGSTAEVARFSAIATYQGQDVPVYVEVARVQDGGDFVVGVGAYPQESEDVASEVETMFESIEH